MKRLIPLFLLLISFQAFAQEDFDPSEPIIDEENLSIEEGSFASELITPQTDEVPSPVAAERQEDIIYPEGEETAWSLGSDELAAEEIE